MTFCDRYKARCLPCMPAGACRPPQEIRGTSGPAGPGHPRCREGSFRRGTGGGRRGRRWASPAGARTPPSWRSRAEDGEVTGGNFSLKTTLHDPTQDVQVTVTEEERNKKINTFKGLASENFVIFCLKKNNSHWLTIFQGWKCFLLRPQLSVTQVSAYMDVFWIDI